MQQSQQDFLDNLRLEATAREASIGQIPGQPGNLASGVVDEDEIFFSKLARYQAATAQATPSAPAWWTMAPPPPPQSRINWSVILPIGSGVAALMIGVALAFGANRQDAGLAAGQGAMRLAAEVVRSDRGSYSCVSLFGCPSPEREPAQSPGSQPVRPVPAPPVQDSRPMETAITPGAPMVVVMGDQRIALGEDQVLLFDPRTNHTRPVTISDDGRGGLSLTMVSSDSQ